MWTLHEFWTKSERSKKPGREIRMSRKRREEPVKNSDFVRFIVWKYCKKNDFWLCCCCLHIQRTCRTMKKVIEKRTTHRLAHTHTHLSIGNTTKNCSFEEWMLKWKQWTCRFKLEKMRVIILEHIKYAFFLFSFKRINITWFTDNSRNNLCESNDLR